MGKSFPAFKKGLIWRTDGFETEQCTGSGKHDHGIKKRFIFILEQYITVLHAEVYSIKVCADEIIKRGY
jgi:hypothetical protein